MRLMDSFDFSQVDFSIKEDDPKRPPKSDAAAAFDIETTTYYRNGDECKTFDPADYKNNPNFYDNAEKFSVMYVWQFAVDSLDGDVLVYMGRTWDEFYSFLFRYALAARLWIGARKKPILYVYVHNLGYEFQFLRGLFNDDFAGSLDKAVTKGAFALPVFARNQRAPMRAVLNMPDAKIEFRDSLCLTQKSLAKWCKDSKLPDAKLSVPSTYYDEARTPNTPLSDFEIQYSINDVVSMVYGIRQYRDRFAGISTIPMTQTGIVRGQIRAAMADSLDWCKMCRDVTINTDFESFKFINHAFVGGWTHANVKYAGKVMENVKCFDFASDYPFCMSVFKYPVGRFEHVTNSDPMFTSWLDDLNGWSDPRSLDITHRYIIEFTATDIKSNFYNTFWSESKAFDLVDGVIDNGKIHSAVSGRFIMTDLDYHMFKRAYSCNIKVTQLFRAAADYLPMGFKNLLFKNYGYKTTLRGVKGEESKYIESKQVINSMYGVAVTKTITDSIVYAEDENGAGDWMKIALSEEGYNAHIEESAEEKDMSKFFLTYPIGVFITAYARFDLWFLISQMDERVVYGDTDSLKGVFNDNDFEVIRHYNEWVVETEKRVATEQDFNESLFHPCQPSGKECRLGVFDREDDCDKFKTLGAKRYAVMHTGSDDIEMTVAGLPKYTKIGNDVYNTADFLGGDFNNFCDGATWDVEQSGKKTHYYNDAQPVGYTVLDRNGNPYTLDCSDKYGIAIMPTTFSIGLADAYKDFVKSLANGFVTIARTDELAEILQN